MFRSTRGGARDRARERASERSIFRSRPSESQRLREAREEGREEGERRGRGFWSSVKQGGRAFVDIASATMRGLPYAALAGAGVLGGMKLHEAMTQK